MEFDLVKQMSFRKGVFANPVFIKYERIINRLLSRDYIWKDYFSFRTTTWLL